MSSLLIVESPTKAKKIYSILQKLYSDPWDTIATLGHMIDLPKSKIGVDVEKGFQPSFVITNRGAWNKVSREVDRADEIFLGMDPDREGEAIAWHTFTRLRTKYPNKSYFRVTFHEITPQAIKDAIENPVGFGHALVESQVSRRLLDRLIGYSVSPVLWSQFDYRNLSAGRVQTCVLSSIVKRTQEVRKFKSEKYYRVVANIGGVVVKGNKKYKTKKEAKKAIKQVKKPIKGKVDKITLKPPPPFQTSTLLNFATRYLKKTVQDVMSGAQFLFEGGLITYHRTESIGMGWQFVSLSRKYLSTLKLPLSDKQRNYPSKGAHECIRPTNPTFVPTSLRDKSASNLYRLIWIRSLETQMPDAKLKRKKVYWGSKDDPILEVTLTKVIDKGWAVLSSGLFDNLNQKQPRNLKITDIGIEEGWTDPPYQYTESSLVKMMESSGIGRPSTYSSTVNILAKRGYISQSNNTLTATLRGEVVDLLIRKTIPELTDVTFTSDMESNLDVIAGKDSLLTTPIILKKYWGILESKVRKAKVFRLPRNLKCSCGADNLKVEFRSKTPYYKCQKCTTNHNIDIEEDTIIHFETVDCNAPCRTCGGVVQLFQSKHGFYKKCGSCGSKVR